MKHLCSSKIIFLLLLFSNTLFASLVDKSAVFYYGKNISYPMVGIHDYIVVEANKTTSYTHGFSLYKDKMYARVDLCKEKKILEEEIDSLFQKKFQNIYFDASSNVCSGEEIDEKLHYFYAKYLFSKVMINAKIHLSNEILGISYVVVVEEESSISEDIIAKIKEYNLDIIYIKTTTINNLENMKNDLEEIQKRGMIPYITNRSFDIYGLSSKEAIKREILTLVDTSSIDKMLLPAHQNGAIVFEYLGYIQKLYDVGDGLPNPDKMQQYAGVVVWLNRNYDSSSEFVEWILELKKREIKVVFVNNFGTDMNTFQLSQLGINIYDGNNDAKKKIIQQDAMISYEIEPSLSDESFFLQPENSKALLTYVDSNELYSVPSAITPWGGYAMRESFMLELNDENIWIINPFKFFEEALRLKKLLVPDTTTENGNRLLFTHIDGDGIMNYVESNPYLFSGEMILNEILKRYEIPHSVSIIGADIVEDGLYPKLSPKLVALAKKIYALPNVEPATHTFTHPFIWGKIYEGNLDEKYRLKPKGYKFSFYDELDGSLEYINKNLSPKREASTIFWSGDCSPKKNVLEYLYQHNALNINGGYTTINNIRPWLTNVSPLGLERGEFYQIYTGAQNENIYTNNWLGPFWGFKKVLQTFQLTNRPKRLKPIDIYYHYYSGSKRASLNALKYVFDWAVQQDVMPIFTSEFIPKVMDYFCVSIANSGDKWLYEGMHNIKTLRVEDAIQSVNLESSKSVLGIQKFDNHTYIALDTKQKHRLSMQKDKNQNTTYLLSSNVKLTEYRNGINIKSYTFEGNVNAKIELHLKNDCRVKSQPKYIKKQQLKENLMLYFNKKKVTVNVFCRS